ncbi:MAG: nitroreductase family protein [Oscillospiraceae bacterium]|nr:nitroreductase family protein [Oscillospiraceae bacterium]
MDVVKAIETRKSIRKYRPDPVEPEKLAQIAEAFRMAPSAGNGQSWKLLIVTDPAAKERMREASPSRHPMITQAPCMLVGLCTTQNVMTNGHRVDTTDVCIAVSFAMLRAHELGLGTCWMANYTEPGLREALGISDDISIVAMMPLGYADEDPEPKPRKAIEEIVSYL